MQWVKKISQECEKILSVCSGALVLALADLLKGLKATTHHQVFDDLERLAPFTKIVRNTRFVDNGKIITSGDISAGIDMSLYLMEPLLGKLTATQTANYMEYNYLPTNAVAQE